MVVSSLRTYKGLGGGDACAEQYCGANAVRALSRAERKDLSRKEERLEI
jgi:hypothetical protein